MDEFDTLMDGLLDVDLANPWLSQTAERDEDEEEDQEFGVKKNSSSNPKAK